MVMLVSVMLFCRLTAKGAKDAKYNCDSAMKVIKLAGRDKYVRRVRRN